MTVAKRTIQQQTSQYDDVYWEHETILNPLTSASPVAFYGVVSTPPAGLKTGMSSFDPHPPYWTFDYEVSAANGLTLKNLCVADAHHAGGSDLIIEEIAFDDLVIEYDGGAPLNFDLASAFANPASLLLIGEDGASYSGTDDLFQRGVLLLLVDTIKDPSTHQDVAKVTLELSIVFRGAKNDFDPAAVPVAVIAWPQIAWTWEQPSGGGGKRVNRFRGTVKVTVCNYMNHAHGTGLPPPEANVPNFFTDSNNAFHQVNRPGADHWTNVQSNIARLPYGWGKLFDYAKLNVQQEFELIAAVGPDYPKSGVKRRETLVWPPGATSRIGVFKLPGQGEYDNLHLHGKMEQKTTTPVEVHAPFCGHSCIHTHWRWGMAVPSGSFPHFETKIKYRGWSRNHKDKVSRAHSQAGSPLTPPNQHVKIALRKAEPSSSVSADFVDPGNSLSLEWLRKQICYQVTIDSPDAGCAQVIWPHGIGWAYRYAKPSESDAVVQIIKHFGGANPPGANATQDDIADFFVQKVYPKFRYVGGSSPLIDQIPDGTYYGTDPPTSNSGLGIADL